MGSPRCSAGQFLRDGLVDELVLHVVPVLLGGGTRLFGALPAQSELALRTWVPGDDVSAITYAVIPRGVSVGTLPPTAVGMPPEPRLMGWVMTDVLILGGTGWLSGRVARAVARTRGVRHLPRSRRPAGAGRRDAGRRRSGRARRVRRGRGATWDEVVEISSIPEHVAAAVDALAPRARHWTYISSALGLRRRTTSSAPTRRAELHEPAVPGEEYDYGARESGGRGIRPRRSRRSRGDRAPGLIVGPGDPTDRFGYWVGRFALAGDEPVLAPDARGAARPR